MRPSLRVYRTVAVVPGQPQSNDVLFSVRMRGQPATITGLAIAETPPWSIGERPDPFNPYAGTKTCRVGGTIEPGGSCGVRVVFAPPTTGTFKGMLTLSTSAGSVDVRLRGEGIPFRPVPQPPILTPASFCANQPNGTPCNADSNGCTLDTCQSGSCTVGSAPNCDDVYTCTTDTCNSTGNNTYTCAHTTNANTCLIGGTCYAEGAGTPGNQCQQCTSALSQTAFSNKADGTTCDAGTDLADALICTSGTCGQCTSFAGSPRFVDNGDGTITDRQTCLVWEKKDQAGDLHDVYMRYSWAGLCGCTTGSCTGFESLCQPNAAAVTPCNVQAGGAGGCAQCSSGTCNVDPFNHSAVTTAWDWLVQLNGSHFASHSDWRLPFMAGDGVQTIPASAPAELESILDAHALGCGSASLPPCVDPVFDTGCVLACTVTDCSCTASSYNWSASTFAPNPESAWFVDFQNGFLGADYKYDGVYVRAVRGSLSGP